jgi:hypothetical protein
VGVRRIDFNLTQASEKISSLFAATLAVELAGVASDVAECTGNATGNCAVIAIQ